MNSLTSNETLGRCEPGVQVVVAHEQGDEGLRFGNEVGGWMVRWWLRKRLSNDLLLASQLYCSRCQY